MPVRYLTVVLVMLLTLLGTLSEARLKIPEIDVGTRCTNRADDDIDTDADAADAGCAASDAFSLIGTDSYAAEAEDCVKSGDWTETADALFSPTGGGGAYVSLPLGSRPKFSGELACAGLPAGTYEIFGLIDVPTNDMRAWIKADDDPFGGIADNSDGMLLNAGQATGRKWVQFGRFGSNDAWKSGVEATTARSLVVESGQILWLVSQGGVKWDCLFARPVGSTDREDCPAEDQGGGGGGSTPTASYDLLEIGANTPTINGSLDAFVTQANAITYSGINTGNTGTCTTRLAWDDSTNRIYFWHECTVANLIDNGSAGVEDSGNVIFGSGLRINARLVDTQRVRDAETYLFAVNTLASYYDRNELNGSPNAAYDFTAKQVAVVYAAGTLTIEGYFQPDEDLTADQLLLLEISAHELRSGVPQTSHFATCNTVATSDPTCWMIAKLSSTTMDVPADTTAPIVGTPSCTPNASGAVCTATTDESGTAVAFRDADNDNEVTTDGEYVTVQCGPDIGMVVTCTFTGLTSPNHEVVIQVTDAAGNPGVSGITDFSLTAAGPELYVSPSGSDAGANDCTNAGTPCKTLAYALPKLNPGDTLILQDGTYASGTTGLLLIDCAAQGLKQGTPSAPITVRAGDPRKARVNGYVEGFNAAKLHNCSYWSIEDIVFAKRSFQDDIQNSTAYAVDIKFSPNSIFRRNVVLGVTGGDPSCSTARGGVISVRDDSNFFLLEENEVYGTSHNGINLKYNRGGIARRNYVHARGGVPCTSGGGHDGIINYPGGEWIHENNIAEGYDVGNGGAFACASYSRNGGIKNTCTGNRYLGLISIGNRLGLSLKNATNQPAIAASLNNTIKHLLVVGDPSFTGTGLLSKDAENTVAQNVSIINMSGGGVATATTSIAGSTVNNTFYGTNVLLSNNTGTGFLIVSGTDDWSMTNLRVFGSNPNLRAKSTGACDNCTSVVQTDPSIGTKRVYTGLSTGAEVIYKYENGALTTNKLWTPSAPSGYSGTSYPFYFSGCGAVTAEAENTNPTDSCVGVANRLNVTTANLPGGY